MKIINPDVKIIDESDGLKKIELCGRVCYKTENKISDNSAVEFIRKIIKNGHESVLEHFHISISTKQGVFDLSRLYKTTCKNYRHFRLSVSDEDIAISGNVRAWRDYLNKKAFQPVGCQISGHADRALIGSILRRDYPVLFSDVELGTSVDNWTEVEKLRGSFIAAESNDYFTAKFVIDRGVGYEFIRHRTLSPSQESTRYCNYGDGNMVFINPTPFEWTTIAADAKAPGFTPYGMWLQAMKHAEFIYTGMIAQGLSPQAARSVLPNSLKTELIMTGTHHQWTEFFKLRLPKSTHPQARHVARMLFELSQIPECIKNDESLKKLI